LEDLNNQETDLSTTTASANQNRRRRSIKPLMIIVVICAVVFAVFIYTSMIGRPYDKTKAAYSNIKIEDGKQDLESVAKLLEDEGIISRASDFMTTSKMFFLTDFKPGTYYLSPSMDSRHIASTLVKGLTTSNGFTIPEGYTVDQIATALEQDGFVDKDRFLKAAGSDIFQGFDFVGSDIKGKDQLEGYLFPGSYSVSSDADETMIIITMLDNFSNFFTDEYRARADELGMSIRDVIIVASLIQKEASIDKEMPLISSVLHNQFNLDMVPENEIPDVPLCSPGKEAITAVLYPEETEYTYYVYSDKLDGSHVFTDDEEEYKELKKAYSKAAKARREARKSIKEKDNAAAGSDGSEPDGTDTSDTDNSEDKSGQEDD